MLILRDPAELSMRKVATAFAIVIRLIREAFWHVSTLRSYTTCAVNALPLDAICVTASGAASVLTFGSTPFTRRNEAAISPLIPKLTLCGTVWVASSAAVEHRPAEVIVAGPVGRLRAKDDVRVGPYRDPPQPRQTRGVSCVRKLREELLDVPQPLPHAPGPLGRLRRDTMQEGNDIRCRRAGVGKPQASYLAQMARISSSLAISPRRAASRERCTAAS